MLYFVIGVEDQVGFNYQHVLKDSISCSLDLIHKIEGTVVLGNLPHRVNRPCLLLKIAGNWMDLKSCFLRTETNKTKVLRVLRNKTSVQAVLCRAGLRPDGGFIWSLCSYAYVSLQWKPGSMGGNHPPWLHVLDL